jgi:competence protein ComEC
VNTPVPTVLDRLPHARWSWLDLRLAPTAAAVWGGTLLAPLLPARSLFVLAALSGGAALAVGVRRPGRVGVRHAVLAVCAALAVTAGTAGVRAAARESSPLTAAATAGRSVAVTLTLGGDPSLLPGSRAQVMGRGTVTALVDGASSVRLDAPVLFFAPSVGWRTRRAGETLTVRARTALPRAGDDVVAVLSIRGPPTLVGGPGMVQRAAGTIRDGLAAATARVLEPRPAGLLPGLVVGDTRSLDPLLAADFKRAGLSHLMAVSGANVAIVVLGVLWPLRRRRVPRRTQAIVAGAALAGFVVLATPGPSVLRAAVMGAITLLALATGRQRAAVPALATSIAVLVLADPGMARDAGFALSVVATASIVVLAPGWSRRLRERGWPRFLADAVAVSGAAGLATAPLVAALSGTVSLVSLPANLLAAPAVAPATVLGLVAALVGPVLPGAGDAFVWLAGWPVRWLILVAERCAAVPDAATGWPAGSGGAVVMTLLLLLGGWALWRFPRWRALALAAVVGAAVLGWPLRQTIRGWPPAQTVLVACDVGQGDALVLPTGPGQAILVDSGREVTGVDRCLDQLGIDSLPLVMLSHLDADHAGGLAGALTGRSIGVVATGTLPPSDTRVPALDRLLARFHRSRVTLVPGERRQVGSAAVDVLAPDPAWATPNASANDMCLVVRVTSGGLRLLLTGDLSARAEARILDTRADVRADVLKVPHHGSADTDPDFLAATDARVALISVGADNTYGHPTQQALTWLAQDAMWVHRTDREGDLAVAGSRQSWGVANHTSP